MITPDLARLFKDVVSQASRFVLTTHMNPDGDAIGSEVGLGRLLAALGKTVHVVNQDPTPKGFRFIEEHGPKAVVYDSAVHDSLFDAADVIVVVDNSAPDRLGRVEPLLVARADKVLCVDHHVTKGTPWRWNVIDDASSATAVIVYELSRELGWTPDAPAATALHAGLATDTGYFRFNSTRPHAHAVAAALLELGADPTRCFAEVFERNSPAFTRLMGHALTSLQIDAGGAVASVRVTRDMVAACDARDVDTSEMTTPLLATEGVRVVLLFREIDDRRVKVSLRSKGALDVQQLASEFGGGGHRNASGIVMAGTLQESIDRVLPRAVALAEGSPG